MKARKETWMIPACFSLFCYHLQYENHFKVSVNFAEKDFFKEIKDPCKTYRFTKDLRNYTKKDEHRKLCHQRKKFFEGYQIGWFYVQKLLCIFELLQQFAKFCVAFCDKETGTIAQSSWKFLGHKTNSFADRCTNRNSCHD